MSTAFTTGFLKRAPSIKSGSDNGNVTQSFRCSVRIWKFQLCNRPFNPVPMYDSSGAVSAQIGIFLFFLYLGNVIQRHSVAFLHLFIEFLIICGDKQVMVDSDLAMLYQVETGALNRAVKRNIKRFPEDFRFQITAEEYENLKCQSGRYRLSLPVFF